MADGLEICGVLPVDKPVGPTSFTMVRHVRRRLGIKKVGHAGTLDPFASGLLLVCVGRPATRRSDRLMAGRKRYIAEVRLGIETDTYDSEGAETARRPVPELDRHQLEECLQRFRGKIMQEPPPYSALKHKGKPLYYYARRGERVRKEPRPVVIHSLSLTGFEGERLFLDILCGKGTYIRSLAADIGRFLGCGGHLTALRRLASGNFSVEQAFAGGHLADAPMEKLLDHMIDIDDILKMLDTSG